MKLFNAVQLKKPRQNKFNLSEEKKLSIKMGTLVPIMVKEVIPGDKFQVSHELFIRTARILSPIMHRIKAYTHSFFVPYRLIWNDWEDFITGGKDGLQEPIVPHISLTDLGTLGESFADESSLWDYLGLPTMSDVDLQLSSQKISTLFFRAYQLIYNEYYRDQKLHDEVEIPKESGEEFSLLSDPTSLFTLRNRCWEKDYFTSANTDPQLGDEVGIPIDFNYKETSEIYQSNGNVMPAGSGSSDQLNNAAAPGDPKLLVKQIGASQYPGRIENLEDDGVSVTVNQLRRSIKLQEWLEKNARAGYRYIEQILSHFGVISKDSRLQRPEFLGGGVQNIVISEVLNNTNDVNDSLGEMAGHGISIGKSNRFRKYFTEHGVIITIMSVLPKLSYSSQGIPKMFSKFNKFDHFWPEFANIGEQEITNQELYFNPSESVATNEGTWGYAPRYSEYKFGLNTIHGEMRSSLKYWHMGREFGSLPGLNSDFVELTETERAELNRIFPVTEQSVDNIYVQAFNSVHAIRSMPYFGNPTI